MPTLSGIHADGDEVIFRVKRTVQFSQVMSAYCRKVGADLESIRFFFDGRRVRPERTPADVSHTFSMACMCAWTSVELETTSVFSSRNFVKYVCVALYRWRWRTRTRSTPGLSSPDVKTTQDRQIHAIVHADYRCARVGVRGPRLAA